MCVSRVAQVVRLVSGIDASIDTQVAEVRQLAGTFGARHARAAVEWTDRLLLTDTRGATGNAAAERSNAALLEQRISLFDECELVAIGQTARCDELRAALDSLQELHQIASLLRARKTAPANIVWSAGDAMPIRLAEWGCDDALWERVRNKRALVRLANTAGGEARCRIRLAKLRRVVDQQEAAKRAWERASRRAARTGKPPPPDVQETAAAEARSAAEARAAERAVQKLADEIEAAQRAARAQETAAAKTKAKAKAAVAATEAVKEAAPKSPSPKHDHSDEYRRSIPPELVEWGCDAEMWSMVRDKNALRRIAKAGDEVRGRKRIASLRKAADAT